MLIVKPLLLLAFILAGTVMSEAAVGKVHHLKSRRAVLMRENVGASSTNYEVFLQLRSGNSTPLMKWAVPTTTPPTAWCRFLDGAEDADSVLLLFETGEHELMFLRRMSPPILPIKETIYASELLKKMRASGGVLKAVWPDRIALEVPGSPPEEWRVDGGNLIAADGSIFVQPPAPSTGMLPVGYVPPSPRPPAGAPIPTRAFSFEWFYLIPGVAMVLVIGVILLLMGRNRMAA
jgi:hypothetical protein